jgi:eukaryotic-like serine/threonine-protein kinase
MSESIEAANDDLESLVGRVADEYTDRVNRGEEVAIEEYATRYPQIADVLRQMLPSLGLMGRLSALSREIEGRRLSTEAVPEYLGDYHIVREIGRGGMGVVYEAEQKSLGRRVALKVLPFHHLMDRLYLKRFEREAQAAARLHHTNIVPLFGVGEHEGIHFYAMQYIAGHGLDRVINELRHFRRLTGSKTNDGGDSDPFADSASSIAQRLCMGRFAASRNQASGIRNQGSEGASARKRGPGPSEGDEIASLSDQSFSQYVRSVARLGIQVADALGYAHSQGVLHRDIKPSNLLLDAAGTIWITDFGLAKADNTEDVTRSGDVIGTLRYVAPERLAGRCDARSDIFSLGLTLYELLTLRPAYNEKVQGLLVQQVTAAEAPSPRKIDRRIPSDLNTIIEKAIAKDPERRYSTASELSKDLQRFLEDRPIQARKTSRAEHAWRWCRRNPSIAGLGAAFVAALLIGLGAVLWQWRLTEGQRQQAEANFKKARDAVDECFTTVTQNPALQEPGMEGARQVLFQAALKYYKDFLNQRADDTGIQADLGRAYYRLGYITERIGSKSEAIAAYEQASVLFEKLVDAEPANPQLRVELAQCYQSLGDLERLRGQSDQAEAQLLKALAARKELVDSNPEEPDYRNEFAGTHQALGALYRTTSRPALAESSYGQAKILREQIVHDFPARGDYRHALAANLSELCRLYWSTGRPVEAEAVLRKALTTLEELIKDYPEVPEYRDSLATGYNALGSFLLNSARDFHQEIEPAYRKALTIRERLVRDHPKVQEYQSELARVYNNLALWHFIAVHNDQAADNYAKALALREQLVRKHPEIGAYQKAVATTHNDLALLYRRDARWSKAERSFHRALTIQEQLLERNREISDFAIELATTRNNLGLIAHDQGKEQVAIDWYTRAAQGLHAVLEAEPRQTDARRLLGQVYAGRASSLSNLGKDSEALADWGRSLEFTRDDLISGARLGRAATLAHLGNHLEAVAEADRHTPKERSMTQLSAAARVYAAAASAAARDPKLGPADRRRRAEQLATRSIELLTRGYEWGELRSKPEVASLKLDRDFDALRSRPDFISLLQKIDASLKK